MKYKSVVAIKRGGPEVLQIVENELRDPAAGEVRIKVLATGVGRTDINYRYGLSPFAPKVPFVPGYEVVGLVDAVGAGVDGLAVGQRVTALTGHGAYSEFMFLGQEHLVSVSASLAPADVAVLVLNYVTAWQMLHNVAKVKAGDKVLIVGASGGVGTALLELGKLAALKMYGLASPGKHKLVAEFGATPIDYHTGDFVGTLRKLEPAGLDFVFDGIGGETSDRSLKALRRGGKLIGYAAPTGLGQILQGLIKLALINLLPNGWSTEFYGITALYMRDKKPFMDDLTRLFKLLEAGQIKPIIAARFPLLEAAKANQMLERGEVFGNIVLIAPELL